MTNIIQTIETDLIAAGKWVESEFEAAANAVWGVVKGVFVQQEPAVVAQVLQAIQTFLQTILAEVQGGKPIEEILTAFMSWAENESKTLFANAQSLGSVFVQALIALAIKDLPSA